MYGQYTRELGEYAKQEAYKAQRRRSSQPKSDILPEGFRAYTPSSCQNCLREYKWACLSLFNVYLFILVG